MATLLQWLDFKIAVILREPKRLEESRRITSDDQTAQNIIRNSTGSFDSFHSLRMTRVHEVKLATSDASASKTPNPA